MPLIIARPRLFAAALATLAVTVPAFAQTEIDLGEMNLEAATGPRALTKAEIETCLKTPENCVAPGKTQFSIAQPSNQLTNQRTVATTSVTQGRVGPTMRIIDHGDPADDAKPLPSIDLTVLFDFNSHSIRADQVGQLLNLAEVLRDNDFGEYRVVFVGHTDAKGSAAYNEALSLKRARSVADLVAGVANLPQHRIDALGYGFRQLADRNDPYSGANRRVQLVLVPSG